ncbi:glutathione S-transferase [Polymorphobacter glacialis]|uniref:Glutathione S-transferase n=1 Tax=Sandarakinorhabdus glacialis TaxID=1614636 RepID=A0A916ZP21_9SPHN|nr:glutathione S-transferase [Polymorphobacter glacialis]GGE07186.1 glutathione S-transferase [Polymorphobacter glacialis]
MIGTLYSFRRCPYAMRARLVLLASGSTFEIREVVLRAKPAELVAVSPKATVPVLILADGRVIDESLDIMRWALGQNDPEDWLAGDDAALIETFDGRFKHHLDLYKYADRHVGDAGEHRAAGLDMLYGLEARLAASPELCGPRRSLADMAIMPFVRQFAAVDSVGFNAESLPRLHGWLARHLESALFARAMVRLGPWSPGAPPVVWPE